MALMGPYETEAAALGACSGICDGQLYVYDVLMTPTGPGTWQGYYDIGTGPGSGCWNESSVIYLYSPDAADNPIPGFGLWVIVNQAVVNTSPGELWVYENPLPDLTAGGIYFGQSGGCAPTDILVQCVP